MRRLTFWPFLCALLMVLFSNTTLLAQTNYVVDDQWVIDYRSPTVYYAGNNDHTDNPGSFQFVTLPSHGSVLWQDFHGTIGFNSYDLSYTGSDTLSYKYCYDVAGTQVCTNTATVSILIIGTNDSENFGSCEMQKNAPSAPSNKGEPINVTNGNMWLEHSDYSLPGIGETIKINRFYNSSVQSSGYFGFGWTTDYDERLVVYDDKMLRLDMPDSKGVFFGRPNTSSPFLSVSADVIAQVVKNQDNTYTLTFQEGRVHKFDTGGRLLWQRDRNGNQTNLSYDTNSRLVSVTDPAGRTLTLVPNPNGTIAQISDSLGVIADYEYFPNTTKLKTVTYADGSKYKFDYVDIVVNGQPRTYLTTVKDGLTPENILETHQYDSQGRAYTSEKHGGVEKYTFSFTSDYTTVTDILGHTTKYDFTRKQGKNLVTRVEGMCGCGGSGSETTSYQYDIWLNIISKTDALGRQTSFEYYADGNLKKQIDVLGTQEFTYNGFGEVLTHKDRMGGVTTNTYSTTGNLLTSTDALNNTTTLTYTTLGQPATIKDARNNTTTLTWDAQGRMTKIKDANNKETNFGYDARARVTSVTNALAQTTNVEYDLNNRLKKIIYPDTNFVTYTYDLAGRRTAVTDPLNHTTTYGYDGAYRLTSVTDALNHTTNFIYDDMSNLLSQTDALGNTTNYEYDAFDRLKKVKYPLPSAGATRLEENYTYDLVGNVKTRVDTAGRTTAYDYDNFNRLIKITDALNQLTQFEYNARSQMTKVKDALNQEYVFTYDPLGRQLTHTRAGSTMTFEYDAVGNRTKRTDYTGRETTYEYDVLNRLKKINYLSSTNNQPPNQTAVYNYDDLSRLVSAINDAGTVSFAYDNRNRLKTETDVFGRVTERVYDAASRRTQLKLDGNVHTSYNYDNADRLTTLTDEASQNFTFAYDVANRLTSRTMPNGITSTFDYDGMSRLTRLKHQSTSATLFDNQYGYNSANQISQIVELTHTKNFTYDNIDRLTSMTNGTTNENYVFDPVGNRTASHRSATYVYQPFNRLTSTATSTQSIDSNGNTVSKSEGSNFWRYIWDYENRLATASTRKQTVRYTYDALGRRVRRNLANGKESTKFIYDDLDVVADDNAGTLTKYQNGLGIDNKLKFASGGTSKYFLPDHLGSTLGIANSTGALSEQNSYDSFGSSTNASFSSRYQFTGREFDSFTGLQYSRARFYDSNLGRFMSEDPIGFKGGDVNLYAYVWNSPTNFSDPEGLWPFRPQKSYPTRGNLPGTSIPYRMDMRQQPYPNMHVYWPDGPQTVVTHKGAWDKNHGGKPTQPPPKSYRANLKPVTKSFLCRVKLKFPGGFGGAFFAIGFIPGILDDYDRWDRANEGGLSYDEQMCEDYGDAGPYIQTSIGVLPNPYQNCKGV